MNKAIKLRQELNYHLRRFLHQQNYLEVDVPTLSPKLIPESYLEVFRTNLTAPELKKEVEFFLLASPEAYLKRLICTEQKNVFYLGKAYRNNEPLSLLHNHEFIILEWYKINYTYKDLMKEIEQMFGFITSKMYVETGIDLQKPWQYLTLEEAYSKYAIGKRPEPDNFEKIYVQDIEPNLGKNGRPTFVYDFPAWQSPLAKAKNGVAERFELYINGVELANGWSELTNPKQQRANLEKENQVRASRGQKELPLDLEFIEALHLGLPNCSGAAMGLDRLLMVLGRFEKIEEVILFPVAKMLKSV